MYTMISIYMYTCFLSICSNNTSHINDILIAQNINSDIYNRLGSSLYGLGPVCIIHFPHLLSMSATCLCFIHWYMYSSRFLCKIWCPLSGIIFCHIQCSTLSYIILRTIWLNATKLPLFFDWQIFLLCMCWVINKGVILLVFNRIMLSFDNYYG